MVALCGEVLVLGEALNDTVPGPGPCPDIMVSHEVLLLVAVHWHEAGRFT